MLQHQKLVFATPVYWYAMSGSMKVLFDRLTDLVTIQKVAGRKLMGKQVYLVAVGAEDTLPVGFEVPFRRTASYFDMQYVAGFYAKAAEDIGDTAARRDFKQHFHSSYTSTK